MCVCALGGGVEGEGRWGLKKQQRLLLGLSPVPCLLAVNLISKEKYTLLPLQCRPLSLVGIRTINHFGNSFQLIKTLPDRDC